MVCSIKAILYPPLCLECSQLLPKQGTLFCTLCLEQLTLVETVERCRRCFGELHKGRCERCIHRPVVIARQIAACEATMGPPLTLLKAICRGRKECLSAAASLMAYQWLKEKMPLPDWLIPLPLSFWQKQQQGLDYNLHLASALGKIFSVPVAPLLTKKFDRERFFTQGEFGTLPMAHAKKSGIVCDRRIVLVAPQLEDLRLRAAASALQPFFPMQIDALCFAAAG